MARADLLETIVRAGAQGDQPLFRRAVEAVIAEERAKRHHVLADKLSTELAAIPLPSLRVVQPQGAATEGSRFLLEIRPSRALASLVLPQFVRAAVDELVEEQHRSDLLRSHSLEPRHRILLTGAPGNGKTSVAEGIAWEIGCPLLAVRYSELIGSYLGETTARLAQLFAYVRSRRCVLFFDEFDAIGKERGDVHETGEIKRVVSALLLEIDALPSHVVVVAATNHGDLLDHAVWRRFQLRLELPPPDRAAVDSWLRTALAEYRLPRGAVGRLAKTLVGASFAELTEFSDDVRRRIILRGDHAKPSEIVASCERQWRARMAVRTAATPGGS